MATATLLPRARAISTGLARRSFAAAPSLAIPVHGAGRPIVVQLAATPADWRQALALVSGNYQARGYEPVGATYRLTPYHLLPDTTVLVARDGPQVVATFSLVCDNTLLGLPMESSYPEEIAQFRREGRRIVETTCLAERGLAARDLAPVLLGLFQAAWQVGLAQGGETNVINVTPRHARFYERALGYLPLGPRRVCPHVHDTVGVALYLDLDRLASRVPRIHAAAARPLPTAALQAARIPQHWLERYAAQSSQTSVREARRIRECLLLHGSPRRW